MIKLSGPGLAVLLALAPWPSAQGAPAQSHGVQTAQRLPFDIFRGRGFPLNTCEFRCQDARNRCDERARNRDERRDCRLEYSVCSNDCSVFNDSR